MKTENKPMKPKVFNASQRDFWYALSLEEERALRELEESFMTNDPITQAKALGRLKRTMMDYFAEKFLVYQGSYNNRQCYAIDYSYHTKWQNGDSFSIVDEIRGIDARPPIEISGCLLH